MKLLQTLAFALLITLLAAAAFVYSGAFNIAADVPHWPLVYKLLESARQRSITARANGIVVPPLDDPQRIAEGAEHYAAMCTGCHLAPGIHESELRAGLYPTPPDFTQRNDLDPAQMFWVIKHGVKLTAMPAWGKTHDDDAIWSLVAFVKKLPELTPEQFKQAASNTGAHEHHHHEHDGSGDPEHADHEHGDHEHDVRNENDEQPHDRTLSSAPGERQAEVRARGPDVMPFALDATQHVFEKTADGGRQRVVARAGHPEQIAKIREHVQGIAHAFAARDFSGPAHIHGTDMPGLAELKAAPATDLTVSYRDIDNGAEVTYRGTTEPVRNAIHRWFDAQLADHGRDAKNHSDHE